ncbi:hypothetical protein K0I63_03060 [Shewanella rhizosphaerae]|uniref:hypothetical protein n=1 Tax=Shewanella rhizosphaerae TaxID=2864207 RepID=UPI001C65F3A0|nr:hypothetical protein [Shewanella rhizosphaerae]QYK13512.1 hypothetical protein K0I63_03060 [Shewanella rhizosphaerae]
MEWSKSEIFKGIDLNDSFVLDWCCEVNRLSFELEASIWPESEHYSKPAGNEYTCYKRATLRFVNVNDVQGLKLKELVRTTTDPDGTVDYGNIDVLNIEEGSFYLVGDFGSVNIQGGKLEFEIHT